MANLAPTSTVHFTVTAIPAEARRKQDGQERNPPQVV